MSKSDRWNGPCGGPTGLQWIHSVLFWTWGSFTTETPWSRKMSLPFRIMRIFWADFWFPSSFGFTMTFSYLINTLIFRTNLTASGPRPNPQGSYHYGMINTTKTFRLANSAGLINGQTKIRSKQRILRASRYPSKACRLLPDWRSFSRREYLR